MPRIPVKQQETLDFLRAYPNSTIQAIAKHFGIQTSGAGKRVRALLSKGLIEATGVVREGQRGVEARMFAPVGDVTEE